MGALGRCLGCSSPPPPNVADATGVWARRHSVANTAKRAIIIVGCAIAFGESMAPLKMIGCSVAIGGIAAGFEVALLRCRPREAFLRRLGHAFHSPWRCARAA